MREPPEDSRARLVMDAVTAGPMSLTVADTRAEDAPLVFVSPGFERLTGFPSDAVLGRNCRFLQGPDTDPEAVARLRRAIRDGRPAAETLLNYRADGRPFWNHVSLTPLFDEQGRLTHVAGVQTDVTARVELSRNLGRAQAAAREAWMQAERVRRELTFLADLSDQVAVGSPAERLHRLARLLVPTIGEAAVVRVTFEPAEPWQAESGVDAEQARQLLDQAGRARAEFGRVGLTDGPAGSVLSAPVLRSDGLPVGLIAVRQPEGRAVERDRLALLDQVARRSGTKLENAWLADLSHRRAVELQRSLLPRLPEVPGLELSAAYVPGSEGAEVGGDWYDVLPLPDGTIGLAVGDVMGHDLIAAASMGQLRSVLRSYAWEGAPPAEVIERLNRLVTGLAMAQLASCVYARLEPPAADGGRLLSYSVAGHPPPLLVTPAGELRRLDDATSPLIGIEVDAGPRPETVLRVEPGSLLLFYTDGAVESREQDLDTAIDELGAWLTVHHDDPVEAIGKDLVESTVRRGMFDDLCLLVVRLR